MNGHTHNLSINSMNSLVEPTTPPAFGTRSALWDNKLGGGVTLPSFNLESSFVNALARGAAPSDMLVPPASPYEAHSRKSLLDPYENKEDIARSYGNNASVASHSRNASNVSNVSIGDNEAGNRRKLDKDFLSVISKLPLAQIAGDIVRLAQDQYGCRFLQKKIDETLVPDEKTRRENFDIIFKEVYPSVYELIIDPFGNYLMQKLIGYCDELYLNLVLENLQANLLHIAVNQHGTRALQRIIDNLTTEHQAKILVKGLQGHIVELIKDLNGNHVIQKILNKYSPMECQFIYDAIIDDLLIVATHKHGCCVLQKCLNHVTEYQLSEFAAKIFSLGNFSKLINDQFGNYVLQYLISINSVEVNQRILNNFISFGINSLCSLKFSSNVVEKFLKNCYDNERKSVEFSILKFVLTFEIVSSDLNKLINDPYGNYVIQTMIDILINENNCYGDIFPTSLLKLLPPDFRSISEPIKIQIIKHNFQNCKILSNFGKRIQPKINSTISGVPSNKKKSRSVSEYAPRPIRSNTLGNLNGVFNGDVTYQSRPNFVTSMGKSTGSTGFVGSTSSTSSSGSVGARNHVRGYSLPMNHYSQLQTSNYVLGNETNSLRTPDYAATPTLNYMTINDPHPMGSSAGDASMYSGPIKLYGAISPGGPMQYQYQYQNQHANQPPPSIRLEEQSPQTPYCGYVTQFRSHH